MASLQHPAGLNDPRLYPAAQVPFDTGKFAAPFQMDLKSFKGNLAACACRAEELILASANEKKGHANLDPVGANSQALQQLESIGMALMSALDDKSVSPDVVAEVGSYCWHLGRRALVSGHPEAAVLWLRQLATRNEFAVQGVSHAALVDAGVQAARPSSALALCLWNAGESKSAMEVAFSCKEDDERAAAVLLLLASSAAVDTKPLSTLGTDRAKALQKLSASSLTILFRKVASFFYQVKGDGAETAFLSVVALTSLRTVASAESHEGQQSILKDGTAAPESLIYTLLQVASVAFEEATKSDDKSQIEDLLSALDSLLAQYWPASMHEPQVQMRVARRVFEFMWNLGIPAGGGGHWSVCADMFERAHVLLSSVQRCMQQSPADSSITMAQVFRISEEVQMCRLLQIAALLEEVRSKANKRSTKLCQRDGERRDAEDVDIRSNASRIMQFAVQARAAAHELAQHQIASGLRTDSQDKALQLLVLMEFESRMLAGDSALSTIMTGMQKQAALNSRCYLMMAKVSLQAGYRETSMECLKMCLDTAAHDATAVLAESDHSSAANRQIPALEMYALACRELIYLYSSRDESLGCFEKVLGFFREVSAVALLYPEEEVQWLISVAWGNGAHFGKAAEFEAAQKWIGVALGFLEFCKSWHGYTQQMMEAYKTCSSQLIRGGGVER